MLYFGALAIGVLWGVGIVVAIMWRKKRYLRVLSRRHDEAMERNRIAAEQVEHKRAELERLETKLKNDASERDRIATERIEREMVQLEHQIATLQKERDEFDARVVSYEQLEKENDILKHDLQNIDVNLRKIEMDRELQDRKQDEISGKVEELGHRYLRENVKWIGKTLTTNNYAACKKNLLDVISRCRGIGFEVSVDEEESLVSDLKADFEKAVKAALEREEQARIKARIREEQRIEREIQRELDRAEKEKAAISKALQQALADAKDEHGAEVQALRQKLAEAEEKARRTVSQAQLTKSGYVYVISNIGSFGDKVFKVGLTRRLEPNDRVRELGDASVPFPFDVHMMISSDDAPALEASLHRALHKVRVNKVNPRKEFFRVDIDAIREFVQANHDGEIEYEADAEALEYNQSLEMSDEDMDYIESVYDANSEGDGIED